MKRQRNLRESLAVLLRALKLPTFVAMFVETAVAGAECAPCRSTHCIRLNLRCLVHNHALRLC